MPDAPRKPIDRKAAIREYKELETERGAFAFRCVPSGQAWVGTSTNLRAAENALRFVLRLSQHREKAMQDAWKLHGEDAFVYEILEKLPSDTAPMLVRDQLKQMGITWAQKVNAVTILL